MENVYILGGARTPFGKFGGSLKDISATELGVIASNAALEKSNLSAEVVDNIVVGNVIHTSKNSSYIARHIALKSGVPIESPALTLNRLCGSGLQAVISAAQAIKLGESSVGLAVGTENMSQSPHVLRDTRFGTGLKNPQIDDMLWATLTDEYIGSGMGITAENLSEKYGISRQVQDEFALQSQQRALAAKESGRLKQEIVPVLMKKKNGKELFVENDEHIRANSTIEDFSILKPAFKQNGSVTAGNASGINDGAGAIVIASETFINQNPTVKPLAKIVSWGLAGVDPNYMGIGPVPAIKQALERAELTIKDIDLFEINEAFAAQYLAVEKELGLVREKVNINGGAIAYGHPVGASGARILNSLVIDLMNQGKKYGVASLCIGGGQGISIIIEVV